MGKPTITLEFLNKANTAISRSEKGIVAIVLTDATKQTKLATYKRTEEVVEGDWTAENYTLILDALKDGANKVHVVRLASTETFSANAVPILDTLKINWLCFVSQTQTDVPTYIKARNAKGNSCLTKAVVYNASSPDDTHIVNFANTKVRKKGASAELDGWKFMPRLCGMLAALPMDRSCTYYVFDDLESVTDVTNVDDAVDAGKFVLFNDFGTVKVARGVNSSTTAEREDMKKITIIEGMDLMREDIIETFKNRYVGKYKNSQDNQMVFISAVNGYFRALAYEEVLNPDSDNLADIDVESQRAAWVKAGKTEALDWSDKTVKANPFRSTVFVKANVMFIDAIEDLEFKVYLN